MQSLTEQGGKAFFKIPFTKSSISLFSQLNYQMCAHPHFAVAGLLNMEIMLYNLFRPNILNCLFNN